MNRILLTLCLLCTIAPVSGQEPIAPMLEFRSGHVLAEVPDGVLAAGGFDGTAVTASCERFLAAEGVWVGAAALPSPRWGATAHAAAGRVFLFGGDDGGTGYPTEILAYDPAADTWTAVAELSAGRTGHASAVLPDGKVLVCGGYDGVVDLASCERFDPVTYAVTPAAPLATGRSSFVLLPITGNAWQGLIAAGGFNPAAGFQLAESERYDPIEDVWTPDAPLPTAVDNLAGAHLWNIPVVTGGRVYDPVANAFAGTSVGAVYDLAFAAWVPFDLAARHSYHAAALRSNAWFFDLVLCGGVDASGDGVATTYAQSERLLLQVAVGSEVISSELITGAPEFSGRWRPAFARHANFGYFTGGDAEGVGTGWRVDLTEIGSTGSPYGTSRPLTVFPNPVHGRAALVGLSLEDAHWTLLNAEGREVRTGRGPELNSAGLAPGAYILRTSAGGRTVRFMVH